MLITDKNRLIAYGEPNRVWQGIPGVTLTKGGRLFITFYSGGVKEEYGNFSLLLRQEGEEFKTVAVADTPNARCYDPCLWTDPKGRLWFIWSVMPDHHVECAVCDDPDADELVWSRVRTIGCDVMLNKPIILSTGEWLFPMAIWNAEGGVRTMSPEHDTKNGPAGSYVYRSVDEGETFEKLGYAVTPERSFDEHMVVELKDNSLLMAVRTTYGIALSRSFDQGRTWSVGERCDWGGPNSRFFIGRLKSGRLLLINHVDFSGRNNLTALLSEDEGKTWPYRLLLDGRSRVSYPDAVEDEDGNIYIVYDRERGCFKKSLEDALGDAREILLARITEEDILRGRLTNDGSYLRRVVNKLGAYEKGDNPFGELSLLGDRELAVKLLEEGQETAVERLFEVYASACPGVSEQESERIDALVARIGEGKRVEETLVELIGVLRKSKQDASPVISRVMADIAADLADETTAAEYAKKYGISVYYLCHLFKKTAGITLTAYRTSLRLIRAKQLLASTEDKIADVAEACGFTNGSYFTELFTANESMTPSKYRALHREGKTS